MMRATSELDIQRNTQTNGILPQLEMGKVLNNDMDSLIQSSERKMSRDEQVSHRLYSFKRKLTESQIMKIEKIRNDKVKNKKIIPLVDGEGSVTYSQRLNSFRLNNKSSRASI